MKTGAITLTMLEWRIFADMGYISAMVHPGGGIRSFHTRVRVHDLFTN